MGENNSKEYDNILYFVNHISDFQDEEICLKMDYAIEFLRDKGLYDLERKLKILAIRAIKDLNVKLDLIKKYYFLKFAYMEPKADWESVMASIENLSEKEKTIILRELLFHSPFVEISKPLNIPSNIKFGIELEYYGISYKQIKKLFDNKSMEIIMKSLQVPSYIIDKISNNCDFEKENEFDKWIFSKEHNDNSPEASSPIMINTLDFLNQLNSICLLFKALHAEVDGGTGLHINIGADYFDGNLDALKYLLLIWGECEELFFKIANQEYETMRVCADVMSIPIKENIQKTFEENPNFTLNNKEDMNRFLYNIQVRERLDDVLGYSHGDLEVELLYARTKEEKYNVFKKYLNEKSKNETSIKYTSINFNHMTWYNDDKGRIEFRLFNSSLDFETVIEDLLLVCRLFETSLALANNIGIKHHYLERLLNRNITEEEKLDSLLDLLFDCEKEKDIFKRRWLSIKDKYTYKRFYTGEKTFKLESMSIC